MVQLVQPYRPAFDNTYGARQLSRLILPPDITHTLQLYNLSRHEGKI